MPFKQVILGQAHCPKRPLGDVQSWKAEGNDSSKTIPSEVKKQMDDKVAVFNQTVISNPNIYYLTRYRGRFLYLDRFRYGRSGPICRLENTGDTDNWDFAIFKYSDERYDPEKWFFPGAGHIDGTVEGAMKAGLEAYPP